MQKLVVTPGQPPDYVDLTPDEVAAYESRQQEAQRWHAAQDDARLQRAQDVRTITASATGAAITADTIAAIGRLLGIPL